MSDRLTDWSSRRCPAPGCGHANATVTSRFSTRAEQTSEISIESGVSIVGVPSRAIQFGAVMGEIRDECCEQT